VEAESEVLKQLKVNNVAELWSNAVSFNNVRCGKIGAKLLLLAPVPIILYYTVFSKKANKIC